VLEMHIERFHCEKRKNQEKEKLGQA
jgi:hypothetical protein